MSGSVLLLRSRLLTRVAVTALLASGLAACSGGVERFGSPIYTGGTANQRAILGGDVSQPSYEDIARGGAQVAPSRQTVARAALPPAPSSNSDTLTTGSIGNATQVAPRQPDLATLPPATPSTAGGANARTYGGWTSAGGTVVTLGRGETLDSAARRYGVPAKAILAVNNRRAEDFREGAEIVIPTYVYSASRITGQAPAVSPAAPVRANEIRERSERVRVVSNAAAIPDAKPRQRVVATDAPSPIAEAVSRPQRKPAPEVAAPVVREPVPQREIAAAAPEPILTNAVASAPEAVPAGTGDARFRWPVNGRVISSFGNKPGGTRNDGINLAVPEGTSVHAAESGTVIYAGNELKGYGNLVLIRHEDGWVSAYAHNSVLEVRRGDTIRRGDVVAKAGSTGNVSQPQLHFELRRGNKPVDPMQYLPRS